MVSFIKQAASAYGADPNVLVEMARRESGFKTGAVNDWDSNAQKGTPSKGLFQFIEPTFKSMAPKAKAANPGAWAGMGEFNWMDWRQQALVAAWAIANGQGSHWTTYKASGGR
ncbi:MAG: transglycosylase SLT domain-containing protein [Armatimonadetes bacterium]|nr:transglycosylase SLT domain-containing protein [Armatimonadota bacterium]